MNYFNSFEFYITAGFTVLLVASIITLKVRRKVLQNDPEYQSRMAEQEAEKKRREAEIREIEEDMMTSFKDAENSDYDYNDSDVGDDNENNTDYSDDDYMDWDGEEE